MQHGEVTQAEFDAALEEVVGEMSAGRLLAIPGVYEVLAEALNNEAIAQAKRRREVDEDDAFLEDDEVDDASG